MIAFSMFLYIIFLALMLIYAIGIIYLAVKFIKFKLK
jgi:hypothetical protein